MQSKTKNSGIVEGFSKPRRQRITRTVIHWVNVKHLPKTPRQCIDAKIKQLYKELEMDSNQILTHKLKLCKN